MSQVISDTINAATDALSLALEALSEEDRQSLLPLFRAHLPQTVADLGFDRVGERVPEQYIKNAIASCMASKLVYKEGTLFISSLPKTQLATMALKYLEKEREVVRIYLFLGFILNRENLSLCLVIADELDGNRGSFKSFRD